MVKKIEMFCILDRSGSMAGAEASTIDGFNTFIKQQTKKLKGAAVTLVLFDNQYEVVYEATKLKQVPKLNGKVYFTRGLTALNDAIAQTLKSAQARHKNDGAPDKAICLIITDGYENASNDYPGEEGRKKVKKMITKLQKKEGWEFFFIGSEIDAQAVGHGIGIPMGSSVTVTSDDRGTRAAYAAMSVNVSATLDGIAAAPLQETYDTLLDDEPEEEDEPAV